MMILIVIMIDYSISCVCLILYVMVPVLKFRENLIPVAFICCVQVWHSKVHTQYSCLYSILVQNTKKEHKKILLRVKTIPPVPGTLYLYGV